ncbi:MAG: hypothetical protein OEV93_01420 [Candidatus Moranbacteria bacterium]|nr:hypothetical protein [Candidatus Moranbacteria bacterium]
MKKVYKVEKKDSRYYYAILFFHTLFATIFAVIGISNMVNGNREVAVTFGTIALFFIMLNVYLYFLNYRIEIDEEKMILCEKIFGFSIFKVNIKDIENFQCFEIAPFYQSSGFEFTPLLFQHEWATLVVISANGKTFKKRWYIEKDKVLKVKSDLLELNSKISDRSLEFKPNPYEKIFRKMWKGVKIDTSKLVIVLFVLVMIFIWIVFK